MAASKSTIRVEGLRELQRDIARADSDLKRELRGELRKLGSVVQQEAKRIAESEGLVHSGNLIRKIGVSVRQDSVSIVERATRDGYPYPRIYEYARGRAFMGPAVANKREQSMDDLEQTLYRVLRRNDL